MFLKGYKKYILSILIILIPIVYLFTISICFHKTNSLKITDGQIDFSNWDFNNKEMIKLDGNWKFYDSKLIHPNDLNSDYKLIKVPSVNQKQGFHTYSIELKNLTPDEFYMLYMPSMPISYKIWLDNDLIYKNGIVSTKDLNHSPKMAQNLVRVAPTSKNATLTIQTSSFTYRQGGLMKSIHMGLKDTVIDIRDKNMVYDFFIIGSLLTIGIYYLMFYFLRNRETSFLYFGLFALIAAIRASTMGTGYFYKVFSFLKFDTVNRISFFLLIAMLMSFLKLFQYIFSKDISEKFVVAYNIFSLAYLVIIFSIPIKYFGMFLSIFQVVLIVCLTYLIYCLAASLKNKREGSIVFSIGVICIAISSINDILHSMGISPIGNTISLGIYSFVLVQTFLTSKLLIDGFQQVEDISFDLKKKNTLKNNLMSNTSVELEAPVKQIVDIVENMLKDIHSDNSENLISQEEKLQFIAHSSKRLKSLVGDMMDFSKLDDNSIELNRIPLDMFLSTQNIIKSIQSILKSDTIKFKNNIVKNEFIALVDKNRFEQILYNVLGLLGRFSTEKEIEISANSFESSIVINISSTVDCAEPDMVKNFIDNLKTPNNIKDDVLKGVAARLSISKEIAKLMGGDLIMIPQESVKDISINITVPRFIEFSKDFLEDIIKTSKAEDIYEFDFNSPNLPAKKYEVLVIEPDSMARNLMVKYLTQKFFNVTALESPYEALSLMDERKFDLLISEAYTADITGYEVCRLIRTRFSIYEFPVIITSKNKDVSTYERAFKVGANDFLLKPLNFVELSVRAQSLCTLKRLYVKTVYI